MPPPKAKPPSPSKSDDPFPPLPVTRTPKIFTQTCPPTTKPIEPSRTHTEPTPTITEIMEVVDEEVFPEDGVDYTAEEVAELLGISQETKPESKAPEQSKPNIATKPIPTPETKDNNPLKSNPKIPASNDLQRKTIPPLMSGKMLKVDGPDKRKGGGPSYASAAKKPTARVEHMLYVYGTNARKAPIFQKEWAKIETFLLGLQEAELLDGSASADEIKIAYAGYDANHQCGIIAAKSEISLEWHKDAIQRYPNVKPFRAWAKGETPELYIVRVFLPPKYTHIKSDNLTPVLKKLNPFLETGIFEWRESEETKGGMAILYETDKDSFQTIRKAGWKLEFLLGDVDCSYVPPNRDPRIKKPQPPPQVPAPIENPILENKISEAIDKLQNLPTQPPRTGITAILPANAAENFRASPEKRKSSGRTQSSSSSSSSSEEESDSEASVTRREAELERSGKSPLKSRKSGSGRQSKRHESSSPEKRSRRSPKKTTSSRTQRRESPEARKRGRPDTSLEKSGGSDRSRNHKKQQRR